MSLRWDPLLVRELARELDDRLRGARLRALRLDGSTRELALLFRDGTLLWHLHPTRGDLRLLAAAEPARSDLTLSARVRAVRAPADERVLIVELLPTRSGPAHDLVVELLGNQWNALVVERPDARIRHVLVRRGGPRPAEVGKVYAPPPASRREGTEAPIGLARWLELLGPVPPPDRRRSLVPAVAWTSTLNAGPLLDGTHDLEAAHALWAELAHGGKPLAPCVHPMPQGLQPYPWPLPGTPAEPCGTLLDAFARAAEAIPDEGASALRAPDLLRGVEAALDDARRRRSSLRAELEGSEDPEATRAVGDLLLARLRDVPSGRSRVTLDGFDGEPVEVALDPAASPHENAAAYYARATKAERARARLPGLISRAHEDVARLETLLERALAGDAADDELRAAIPERPGRSVAEVVESLPYRSFRSSGGLEIRVGRSARLNDELTFRHSAPDDVFLHARHAAGAHVILRWRGPGNPPARDLEEAAVLAAVYSKARTSGSAPVDWTLRKYVRKPRRAPPGTVTVERVRTLFVEPDPALPERLASPGSPQDLPAEP